MSSGAVSFLNKYDIFGKSIPGALLVVLAYFLLPQKPDIPVATTESQFGLILRLITALLLGLLIGEAVHTLARILEGIMLRVGGTVASFFRIIEYLVSSVKTEYRKKSFHIRKGDWENNHEPSRIEAVIFVLSIISTILIPVWAIFRLMRLIGDSIYYYFYPVLQRHRTIFDLHQLSAFAGDYPISWEPATDEDRMESFQNICDRVYNIQIDRNPPSRALYTTVASCVSQHNPDLSQRFQDLYSFCRSMWVVLFLGLLWYIIVLFDTSTGNNPWWYSGETEKFLPLALLTISMILFMHASKRYKLAYIEYLISDFINIHSKDSNYAAPDSD